MSDVGNAHLCTTTLLLPLRRTEDCAQCGTDLHVCRMCRFYDKGVSNACREPIADFVSDKTRANFCGYLELRDDGGSGSECGAENDDLDALFGLNEYKNDVAEATGSGSIDDLFGLKDGSDR